MPESSKILGIAGSLRGTSYNKGALRAAQQLCHKGAKIETFDLAVSYPCFAGHAEPNDTRDMRNRSRTCTTAVARQKIRNRLRAQIKQAKKAARSKA